VIWDFGDGGYRCPRCEDAFESLGDHVIEQIDWLVTVRLVVHRRRRYRRRCRCPVPATVMAPGPPKAIGKGLLTNGFLAQLFTERYVAGRNLHSLTAGLARHGQLAARIWTVTATAEMAGLNVLTYLTAYLDACGRNNSKPLARPRLERFLPWTADPADLRAWAQPPPPS
jgi:transposase